MKKIFLPLFLTLIYFSISYSQQNTDFYPGGIYNDNVPAPKQVIGIDIGERPARYFEIYNYFRELEKNSDRVKLYEGLSTYEGRKLFYIVVSSEENINKIAEIKSNINKLSDPRITENSKEIINSSPAVAMMMYSIHGDELSGSDASVQLAYQLSAGLDEATNKILNNVVTIIYPMENPDGRERYLSMMQQWQTDKPNSDVQSIQHTGVWPWGRTNHYFFDLNRDWFILAHPESRDRVEVIHEWNPQLTVDAHEMGSYSTYFFNPPREPIHYGISNKIKKWWKVYSEDQAEAFDKHGWSYYTKESFDEFYPGYGSSYPYFLSSVGILYEQAQTDGTIVKRPAEDKLTFHEAVNHQFTSSFSNLKTLAENRKEILNDFYEMKKSAIEENIKHDVKAYIIDPAKNRSRTNKLIERLLLHKIEVEKTEEQIELKNVISFWDDKSVNKKFSKGSYIIKTNQPLQSLINAIIEFDPRLSNENLKEERESLEKGEGTKMYEIGAWSMLLAFNVDAYISSTIPSVKTSSVKEIVTEKGELINSNPDYGFLIDFSDDKIYNVLLSLFKNEIKVHSAEKPFKIEGNNFQRGTLLIRKYENPEIDENLLNKIASDYGINIYGVNTALTDEGPNLGGNKFNLLEAPVIGLLTGSSISSNDFGDIWYCLDQELQPDYSLLNSEYFNRMDLRKYNVIIMPPGNYKEILGKDGKKKVKDWIEDGGTLIATGSAAVFLADTSEGFCKTSLFSQSLKKYDEFMKELKSEKNIGNYKVDSVEFWKKNSFEISKEKIKEDKAKELTEEELKEIDKKGKLFMPRGSIVRLNLDEENYLTFGEGSKVPAIIYTSNAFLAKDPVNVAARCANKNDIRLSGLLWPEAKLRWENTAYLTRERMGNGQVILFLDDPNFRSYFYGTNRLLLNGILLGPGFGTRQTVEF